jgi:ATP-dependent DNA ligase
MKYNTYRYIYPPRPRNAISPEDLTFWDNRTLIGQPKINGSNCVIFTNGIKTFVMNRHNERLTNFNITQDELKGIFKCQEGEWMVINGEYLNKSKQDERGVVFNHKLIIFDILVYKSEYLVGQTFEERIALLDEIFGTKDSEKSYLYSISENIYRVKSYYTGFKTMFDELTKIDVIEGWVLKRENARLEIGNTENNNTKSQLKARKPTKLYKY